MPDSLVQLWDLLVERASGPIKFRLIIQPTVATILAVRAGLKDAREGRPPFLWAVFTHPGRRRELLRQGWGDVWKVFAIAIALDAVYQLKVHGVIKPMDLLLTATTLAIIPYVIVRGPVTRLARPHRKRDS